LIIKEENPLHLVLLGSPGTGKGTQAKALSQRFGWPHISSGDLLREAVAAENAVGREAKAYMDRGALVPDELVIKMLLERIGQPDAIGGFILDGFPRNLPQAIALDEALAARKNKLDLAINLAVSQDELVRRLSARRVCPNCGAIYQLLSKPPREAEKCDVCGSQLVQREDDKPETVRKRLDAQWTPPDLMAHYRRQRKLADIDGSMPVAKVTEALVEAVKSRSGSK
jgi:adenylate kinase